MSIAQSDIQFRTPKGPCLLRMVRGEGMLLFVDGQPAGDVGREIIAIAMAEPQSAPDFLASYVEDISGPMEGREGIVQGIDLAPAFRTPA